MTWFFLSKQLGGGASRVPDFQVAPCSSWGQVGDSSWTYGERIVVGELCEALAFPLP